MYCLGAKSLKNQGFPYKINDICIAWVLNHCKNNAIHCKINDICIAWNKYKQAASILLCTYPYFPAWGARRFVSSKCCKAFNLGPSHAGCKAVHSAV